MAVGTDGPGGVFVPISSANFTELGLAAPNHLFLCQETSGNLQAVIGGDVSGLAPVGSGHLYNQSVSGWTRKFVGLPDASDVYFGRAASNYIVAVGQSYAIMFLASIGVASVKPGATLFVRPGNGIFNESMGSVAYARHGNVDVNFANNHTNLAVVHPWIWYRNCATNRSGIITDLEWHLGRHYEGEGIDSVEFGDASAGGTWGSGPLRVGYVAVWSGSNAERDWSAYLQTLGWNPPTAPTPIADKQSGIYSPQDSAEFTALGVPVPTALWSCQDSGNPLEPNIGTGDLEDNGSGHLYSQSVAGWERVFLGLPASGALTRWGANLYNLAAGESFAMLVYGGMNQDAGTGGTEWLFQANGDANGVHAPANNQIPRTEHNNVSVALASAHGGAAYPIHAYLWYRRADINESGLITDIERKLGTHDEGATSGLFTTLGASGTSSECADSRFGLAMVWRGVNAERDWPEVLDALGWNVTWLRLGQGGGSLADLTASAAAQAEVLATCTATLGACFATASGIVDLASQAMVTLAPATDTVTGTVAVNGASAPTLAALAPSASGQVASLGQTTATLESIAGGLLQAVGTVSVPGQSAVTLAGLSQVANGMADVQGSLAGSLTAALMSASGGLDVQSLAALSLALLSETGSGTVEIGGQCAATLAAVAGAGAAIAEIAGQSGASLAALNAAATGAADIIGGSDLIMALLSPNASGAVDTVAQAALMLTGLAIAASAGLDITSDSMVGLEPLGPVGSGMIEVSGDCAAGLDETAFESAGIVDVEGRVNLGFDDVIANGSTTADLNGLLLAMLDDASIAGDSAIEVVGLCDAILIDALAMGGSESVIIGDCDIALDDASASGDGLLDVFGLADSGFEDAGLSADAATETNLVLGEADIALNDGGFLSEGLIEVSSQSDATLDELTGLSQAALSVDGAAELVLDGLSQAVSASLEVTGEGSGELDAALAMGGSEETFGEVDIALEGGLLQAGGENAVSGQLDVALGDLSQASSAVAESAAVIEGLLDELTASGEGGVIAAGQSGVMLSDAVAQGASDSMVQGGGTFVLNDADCTSDGFVAIGVSADATLDSAAVIADGKLSVSGQAAMTLGTLRQTYRDRTAGDWDRAISGGGWFEDLMGIAQWD